MILDELDQNQREIYSAIVDYNVFPIDEDHLEIDNIDGEKCLVLRFEARDDSEFSVEVGFSKRSYIIYCEGWHDEFKLIEDEKINVSHIIEKLVTLFNGKTKLVTKHASEKPYKWVLLYNYENDDWGFLGSICLIFYNYFGKRKVTETTNRIITPDD